MFNTITMVRNEGSKWWFNKIARADAADTQSKKPNVKYYPDPSIYV